MEKQKLSRPNRAIIALYNKGYRAKGDGTILKSNGKLQPLTINHNKYRQFVVKFEGTQVCIFAHRFIAYQWMGKKIFDGDKFVLHINDVKSDNRIENLKLGTRKDNIRDAKRNGIKLGRKNLDHDEIYRYYSINGTRRTVDHFNISQASVNIIIRKYKNAESRTTSQIPIPFYD